MTLRAAAGVRPNISLSQLAPELKTALSPCRHAE
jgi:hypothetical protein